MTVSARSSTATGMLVDWARDLHTSGVTDKDRDTVRYFLLDHLANVFGGLPADSSQTMLAFARERPGECATVGGSPVIDEYSALVSGTSAHALEFDDTHQPSSSHPGSAVFPAALVTAAGRDRPFSELASAVVAGYEVASRVGVAATAKGQYERGFHPTGTSGVFGATIAAGLLANLTREQMVSAMGIALAVSAGSMAFLADGSWTKRMHPGWAAHSAIIATRLASRGFFGPQEPLTGPDGFLHSHSLRSNPELLTKDLGERPYAIARTSIKAHGCCRYMQAPIDAILQIMNENDFAPDDVEEVSIGVLEAGWDIIAEPVEQKRRPKSTVDAQFSMAFGGAAAILYKRVGVTESRPENLSSDSLVSLMERVTCVRSEKLDAMFPERWPAEVEISLRDGRRLSAFVAYPKGDPENPLTQSEMEEKFRTLTEPVIAGTGQDRVLGAVRDLGQSTTPADLQSLIGSPDLLTEGAIRNA